MFGRMLRSLLVAGACVATVRWIPDVARYLRIRQPEPRPVPGIDGVRNT